VVVVAVGPAHDEHGLAATGAGILDEALVAPALDRAVGGGEADPGLVRASSGMQLAGAEGVADRLPGVEQRLAVAAVSSRLHAVQGSRPRAGSQEVELRSVFISVSLRMCRRR
jgi:hypothetical protein